MPISSLPLPGDEEPPDSSSQVAWLRSLGDREALFQIMEGAERSTQSLEAAEALAQLGDVRGLDHLIAMANDPRSGLRMEAAEILQDLGHPRGLRALREQQTETQSSDRAGQREGAYEDLNAATTDELMAIWHENDRAAWTDMEFDVIETILLERLGNLPRRGTDPASGEDIDAEVDPRIQQMWKRADVDGLRRLLERDSDASLRLEAAEALADLGDDDALDFLIEILDEADEEYSEVAAGMLDWLDLPRGNAALRERGYAFETDATNRIEAQPTQRPRAASTGDGRAGQAPDWMPAGRSWASRVPTMPGESAGAAREEQSASSGASLAAIVTGAMGGVLGFLFVHVSLHLLAIRALPEGPREWTQASMVYALIESLVIGAITGSVGSRAIRATATRAGDDVEEQDARLVLGALASGAICVIAVEVLRFLLSG
jgi:hypothetical protein